VKYISAASLNQTSKTSPRYYKGHPESRDRLVIKKNKHNKSKNKFNVSLLQTPSNFSTQQPPTFRHFFESDVQVTIHCDKFL